MTGISKRIVAGVAAAVALFGVPGCSTGADGASGSSEPSSARSADPTDGLGDPEGVDPLPPIDDGVALPIVFVHGFAGSAQQYESQAMRFVANGYPQERIIAYDHDGSGFDIAGYAAGVDAVVDAARAEFGVDQVYLVGHSRGTIVSTSYLGDPTRAAKIAKYVAIDGAPCPEVVPCIAPTQADLPGQSHVEVATSPQSFAMQYEFLVGEAPAVVDIEPQREPVVLSGRAVVFPANTGRAGATLDIWKIEASTGQRIGSVPRETFELEADGAFGPITVETGGQYEYVLSTESSPVEHHIYLPAYQRSSDLVRLLSSEPDGATRANTNVDEAHSSIVAMRMREWYASDDPDLPGDETDVLRVSVDGGAPVDAITDFVGNRGIGLHLHDDAATPGLSSLAALPYFATQPFQSGVDVFLPASDPSTGTITVTNLPRGDVDHPQTFNVPNWPSSEHSISLVFSDHVGTAT